MPTKQHLRVLTKNIYKHVLLLPILINLACLGYGILMGTIGYILGFGWGMFFLVFPGIVLILAGPYYIYGKFDAGERYSTWGFLIGCVLPIGGFMSTYHYLYFKYSPKIENISPSEAFTVKDKYDIFILKDFEIPEGTRKVWQTSYTYKENNRTKREFVDYFSWPLLDSNAVFDEQKHKIWVTIRKETGSSPSKNPTYKLNRQAVFFTKRTDSFREYFDKHLEAIDRRSSQMTPKQELFILEPQYKSPEESAQTQIRTITNVTAFFDIIWIFFLFIYEIYYFIKHRPKE